MPDHAPAARRPRRMGADTAERISAGCYGALVAASTLIGLGEAPLGEVILIVVLTNVVYYATHVFAYSIGDANDSEAKVGTVLLHHLAVGAPMVSAAFTPLVVVIVLQVVGVGSRVATGWGVAVALLYLVIIATTGAYVRRYPVLGIVLTAAVTTVLAVALLAVKLNLH